MNAILITLNIIVLSCLVALGLRWPPALFAFLVVGPLSIISIWGISKGGLSARLIFVSTAAIAIAGVVLASYFWPAASPSSTIGPMLPWSIYARTQSGSCTVSFRDRSTLLTLDWSPR